MGVGPIVVRDALEGLTDQGYVPVRINMMQGWHLLDLDLKQQAFELVGKYLPKIPVINVRYLLSSLIDAMEHLPENLRSTATKLINGNVQQIPGDGGSSIQAELESKGYKVHDASI